MPVEIREIIIRTDISTASRERGSVAGLKELEKLKQQIRNECMQLISANTKKTGYKR